MKFLDVGKAVMQGSLLKFFRLNFGFSLTGRCSEGILDDNIGVGMRTICQPDRHSGSMACISLTEIIVRRLVDNRPGEALLFEIHSLRLGELMIPQGESFLRDPVHAWYITDGNRHILVDSGMADAGQIKQKLRIDGSGGGHESLRVTLAACGTTPEAIDTVILTHLHFDHAWNLDLFTHAQVIVQREELMHAIDPAPTQRIYYPKEIISELLGRKRPSRLLLLNGDTDLVPGLSMLMAPGHTPGMHIAVVATARGKVALVSDLGDHYRCWFPADPRATDRPMRYLSDSYLPGIIRSESEHCYLQSMRRVRAASDIIVPAHDFRIPVHMPQDWFEIPESTDGDLGHVRLVRN